MWKCWGLSWRLGYEKHRGYVLPPAQIPCSGDSQLMCCKDTQEALWSGLHGEHMKQLANSWA